MGRLTRKRGKTSVSRCEHQMQNWFKLLDYSYVVGTSADTGVFVSLSKNPPSTRLLYKVSAISDADY